MTKPKPVRTKRQIKASYLKADIGLTDALRELMFDHGMNQGDALRYLGL